MSMENRTATEKTAVKKKKISLKLEHIVLTVIILAQFIATFWIFATQKDIYYTDEYYSYGISNSFERPFLHCDSVFHLDITSVTDGCQWLAGEDFKYYLRTKPETAFRYDSVWHNSGKDTIPPLHYTILHTLCSFNPGHFSWYDAFVINLVCLVITQIFVYLLTAEITRSKHAALLTVAFWGFSLGGISCFTYLRMYAMLVMFCMIFAWLTSRVHTKEKFSWSDAVWDCVITFLGAMTHHNFLIFAFFCALFSCLFLLFQRAWRKLFSYGFSVVGGVLLSVAVFPATIRQMTVTTGFWSVAPDLWANAPLFQAVIKKSLLGDMHVSRDLYASVIAVLVSIILFSIPILFLFRDKPFVKSLLAWLKKAPKSVWRRLSDPHKMHPGSLVLLLTTFGYFLIIAGMTGFWDLTTLSIRYFYLILPVLVMLTVGFVTLLLRKCKMLIRNIALAVCVLGMAGILGYQHMNNSPEYVRKAPEDNATTQLSADMQDCDCIVLLESFRNEQCLSELIENTDQVLIVQYIPQLLRSENCIAEMQKVFDQGRPFYLILDCNSMYDSDYDPDEFEYDGIGDNAFKHIESMYYDELLKENQVVEYVESLSGCSAVYCGNAYTQNLTCLAVYRFTPSEQ